MAKKYIHAFIISTTSNKCINVLFYISVVKEKKQVCKKVMLDKVLFFSIIFVNFSTNKLSISITEPHTGISYEH